MREGGAVSLAVVGAIHANADGSDRRFEIRLCRPGDPLELWPEPENKHDSNAIAVFRVSGGQLGYVSAERAPWLGKLLASGRDWRAVFQAETHFGAWLRIAFDGAEPTLPAQRAEAEEPDFYPDEEWPDL